MKNKLIATTMILFISVSFAMAQEKQTTSFAILGGVNFQNLNGKDIDGDKLENDMILGYHGGVEAQIPIAPEFYFQPGLMFTTKGAKNTFGSVESNVKLNYIEVPLNLVYKAALGNGFIMLGFGPYLGYGISGKQKTEDGTLSLTQDVEFQNTVDASESLLVPYYKAFDAGANIFFGYEMTNGIFIRLDTQLGMVNINPEYEVIPEDKSAVKNTGFGLSLGYRM